MNNDNESNSKTSDTSTDSQAASDLPHENRQEPLPAEKPSQAEGDRETIDADIRQKEKSGDL